MLPNQNEPPGDKLENPGTEQFKNVSFILNGEGKVGERKRLLLSMLDHARSEGKKEGLREAMKVAEEERKLLETTWKENENAGYEFIELTRVLSRLNLLNKE